MVMTTSIKPRKMRTDELIPLLVTEHSKMRSLIARIEGSLDKRDYEGSLEALKELDGLFKQHIADEEAQILSLLIQTYGVKGAQTAITIFRQHRPIYQLMQVVQEYARSSPTRLASDAPSLREALKTHADAEEALVFPEALTAARAGRGRHSA